MRRAMMWLNLYSWTAWRPYSLSHTNALHINLSYSTKDQSMKFWWKKLRIGRAGKFCFVFCYWVVQKFLFCFFSMSITKPFIWGSVCFCTMDGFFRIFKKAVSELICTRLYMHCRWLYIIHHNFAWWWWKSLLAFLLRQ